MEDSKMGVEWAERKGARSFEPSGYATVCLDHVGGRLREEAVISVVSSDRSDGRRLAKILADSYVENGCVVVRIQYVGRIIGDKKYHLSQGWKSYLPPVRMQFTVISKLGELGPEMPTLKVFRPLSEYHLKYLITCGLFDVIVIECLGDTLEEAEQKNFHYRQLARDILIAARGHRSTVITVTEVLENLHGEPPTALPLKNWAKGVSPYAEKLVDECIFIGNSGGEDQPQWLCNPVRGTKELVWADRSADIYRKVGQLGEYYYADGDSFALTEKARQLGLLCPASVADHIELESGSWKECA
jgi:hypothetical protein